MKLARCRKPGTGSLDFLPGVNMPSRRAVALIFLFWLAVTGYVAYRDAWPVLFASGPPPVAIDLADEAAQRLPTRWTVSWNGKPVGKMTTQMKYVEEDDTFRFTTDYHNLRVEVPGGMMVVPEFNTVVRVTRAGDLREQSASGKLEFHLGDFKVADATAKLTGTVADGQLLASFEGSFGLAGMPPRTLSKALDPVPVPKGQPLNPMQPVNRIGGVRPGRRWHVHESDPMKDVREALVKELGIKPPDEKKGPLIGEVLSDRQEIVWQKQPAACWVIEYRRDGEVEVRTWVRAADGKVLKQEAYQKGETLTVDRDD